MCGRPFTQPESRGSALPCSGRELLGPSREAALRGHEEAACRQRGVRGVQVPVHQPQLRQALQGGVGPLGHPHVLLLLRPGCSSPEMGAGDRPCYIALCTHDKVSSKPLSCVVTLSREAPGFRERAWGGDSQSDRAGPRLPPPQPGSALTPTL